MLTKRYFSGLLFLFAILSCNIEKTIEVPTDHSVPESEIVFLLNDSVDLIHWGTLLGKTKNVINITTGEAVELKAVFIDSPKGTEDWTIKWYVDGVQANEGLILSFVPEKSSVFITCELVNKHNNSLNRFYFYELHFIYSKPVLKKTPLAQKPPLKKPPVEPTPPPSIIVKPNCKHLSEHWKVVDISTCAVFTHKPIWSSMVNNRDCPIEIERISFYISDAAQIGTQYYNLKIIFKGRSIYDSGRKVMRYGLNSISVPAGIFLPEAGNYQFTLTWIEESRLNQEIAAPRFLNPASCNMQLNKGKALSYVQGDFPFVEIKYHVIEHNNSSLQ